jgi:hypothetical protein
VQLAFCVGDELRQNTRIDTRVERCLRFPQQLLAAATVTLC